LLHGAPIKLLLFLSKINSGGGLSPVSQEVSAIDEQAAMMPAKIKATIYHFPQADSKEFGKPSPLFPAVSLLPGLGYSLTGRHVLNYLGY
jgi:hypothetical protein